MEAEDIGVGWEIFKGIAYIFWFVVVSYLSLFPLTDPVAYVNDHFPVVYIHFLIKLFC